jgi:hypothetical protein
MMRKLASDHQVASLQELLELAGDMGVRLIPCQMTMDLLGLTREDMIDGLEEPPARPPPRPRPRTPSPCSSEASHGRRGRLSSQARAPERE